MIGGRAATGSATTVASEAGSRAFSQSIGTWKVTRVPSPSRLCDVDTAAVQRHQTLDDREAEPGAVVAPVVARSRLEERIADARQIGIADPDAGVRDGDGDRTALGSSR